MNDASVAILMLGAGRCRRTWANVSREGRRARDDEEHSATSVTGHDEHHRRRGQHSAIVQYHTSPLLRYVLPVAELCRLDVPVFREGGRRPLHCVYDSHRCKGADVPHVITVGRLMHAGDANAISAESVTALGYTRDHPSKYSRYVDRNLPTADGKGRLTVIAAYHRQVANVIVRGAYSDNIIRRSTTQVTFKCVGGH